MRYIEYIMFVKKAKARQISPKTSDNQSSTPTKFNSFEYTAAFDLNLDELEVLKRYESVYHSFIEFNVLKPLTKPFTKDDIGRIQGTILDFSCAYALQGDSYITEIQSNLQYTVLQSALILTISMPLYISPPEIDSVVTTHVFSGLIGLAAFSHIIVIVALTILSALLNRPYAASDVVVMRVKSNIHMTLAVILNYVADIASIIAMFVAGFSRSKLDGLVQLYAVLLFVLVLVLFLTSMKLGDQFQDMRTLKFFQKYCDITGSLRPEYLVMIYESDKEELEEDQQQHGQVFKIEE